MQQRMIQYDLILAGAGHAHLGVLRRWALVERPPGRIAFCLLYTSRCV